MTIDAGLVFIRICSSSRSTIKPIPVRQAGSRALPEWLRGAKRKVQPGIFLVCLILTAQAT